MFTIFERVILYIISLLDKLEKPNYDLDETGKLVKSFPLKGVKVWTDTGWQEAGFIHQTRPFDIWKIKTETHSLECADLHKVFRSDYTEVFVDELKIGDEILTENGPEKVTDITKTDISVCMSDLTIMDGNERFYTNGILSHNTTTSAIFILWYILFNVDKNSLVLGNKRKTAVEILDKVKKIYLELPYYLKPGVLKWNEGEIVLDNGCRCMCEATTINSGISFTFHCILADEFAHIPANILDKFYNNLFPTITAAQARFIITSTQNGYNLFYRLYTAAEAGENDYSPYKVDWWQVPEWNPEKCCWEKRDDAWHKRQVANYGGEDEFNKQFGTNFDVSANTLIKPQLVRQFQQGCHKFKSKDLYGVSYSENWYWREDVEPMEYLRIPGKFFIITCDLAEGLGKDYTIFNVIEVYYTGHMFKYETVGYFRSNKIALDVTELSLREFCSIYMNEENCLISIERNTYGELFVEYIKRDIDKNETRFNASGFNTSMLVKYPGSRQGELVSGIKVSSANKSIACNQFKRMFECGEYSCKSIDFIQEVNNFSDNKGNGTYAASFGHDDLIMTAVQLYFVTTSINFKSMQDTIIEATNNPESVSSSQAYNPFGGNEVRFSGGTIYDFL